MEDKIIWSNQPCETTVNFNRKTWNMSRDDKQNKGRIQVNNAANLM